MTKAVALALSHARQPAEIVRGAIVLSCAAALIFAGQAAPAIL